MSKRPSQRPSQGPGVNGRLAAECPICRMIFNNGTVGWSHHIGAIDKHADWHPEITDSNARCAKFVNEFPEFFAHAKTKARRIPPSERSAETAGAAGALAGELNGHSSVPPPSMHPSVPAPSIAVVNALQPDTTHVCPTCGGPVDVLYRHKG